MRKFVLAISVFFISLGLALAAEVTVVKVDGKKIVVKEGDAEKTYLVTDDTKVKVGDKDVDIGKAMSRMKEGMKLDVTTSGDKLTEIKFKRK